jgi:spore coat protein CotH
MIKMRLLALFLLLLSCTVASAQTVVINEFMADNDNIAADQDGEYDDWIELFNNGDQAVSLTGYCLSDAGDDLLQWVFPDTSIAAGGYLIIWADEDDTQSGLHANFKLSASGEAIYLSNSEGTLIDQVIFGPQVTDVSYGRYPNGTGTFVSMEPSFDAENINPGSGGDDIGGIFGDTLIQKIDLEFYVEGWQDSLKYNFEVLDEVYMPARLIFNDTLILDSIGVRYKGNSSYVISGITPKKPFEFKFDKYRDDQRLSGLKKLNVQNGVSDPSFLRETLSYGLARRYMPAPRTCYADFYVNGDLLGFYILVEQVDKPFLAGHWLDNDGNLYKASDNGGTLEYRGENQSSYESEYELKTNEDENDWSRFVTMIDLLNNTSDDSFVTTIKDYLNIDTCLRYLAFNMVLSNFDSYTGSSRNYYMYDDPTSGRFAIIPWDLNESFGVYTNNWNVITQDIINIPNIVLRPLEKRLLDNDSLRGVYLNYIDDMIKGAASADSIAAMAEKLETLISSHVFADTNKLYTDLNFTNNIEKDVYVGTGQAIPGIKSFSLARNANLSLQLSSGQVYPGDADNNGVVNAFDVLPIGVYFKSNGSSRESVSFVWGAQRALLWETPAATYADVNGDGVVDEKDVIGIGVNWGNSHESTAQSYEMDPSSPTLLNENKDKLMALYNSLSSDAEPIVAMRALLKTILGGQGGSEMPEVFALEQNYPNPFNPQTTISFSLPKTGPVTLTVYDLLGRVVYRPVAGQIMTAGHYEYNFDFSGYASGIYFYRLETESGTLVRKMTLLK